MEIINAVGRRKRSVARVYVREGKGNITVNKKDYNEYFPYFRHRKVIDAPLKQLEVEGNYDIKANLRGGGIRGQAEAMQLAIARALVKINEEDKKVLKDSGYLLRDAREKERKKPGRPKARKRPQFSKR